MPPDFRRAFQTVAPQSVPLLAVMVGVMLCLLFPQAPWWVRLPLSLVLLALLLLLFARVMAEYRELQLDRLDEGSAPDEFVPLEPLHVPAARRLP